MPRKKKVELSDEAREMLRKLEAKALRKMRDTPEGQMRTRHLRALLAKR